MIMLFTAYALSNLLEAPDRFIGLPSDLGRLDAASGGELEVRASESRINMNLVVLHAWDGSRGASAANAARAFQASQPVSGDIVCCRGHCARRPSARERSLERTVTTAAVVPDGTVRELWNFLLFPHPAVSLALLCHRVG